MKNGIRLSTLTALAATAALVLGGCEKKIGEEIPGPLTFQVDLATGYGDAGLGSEENPLPFTTDEMVLSFDLTTLDREGNLDTSFNGRVKARVAPRGELVSAAPLWFQVENGKAENMSVPLKKVHGTTTVWFENATDEEQTGNYATGISPVITAVNPTIRNIQEVGENKHLTSALKGDFVEIDLGGRVAVVTGVANDGFYMTDISEPDFLYSSMYVYNHSRPDVEAGAQLTRLSGTVDEFFGFTELGFPSWKQEGEVELPDPVEITSSLAGDNDAMEPYESALVQVSDVVVCPMGESFETYGQWAVTLDGQGSCGDDAAKVNVISAFTYSSFNPEDYVGQTLERLVGNLRFHSAAKPNWIIYVRGSSDIEVAAQENINTPGAVIDAAGDAKGLGGKQ